VALCVALLLTSVVSSSRLARAPTPHIETSQHFRLVR
jgi:hypothetical protein